ncbi:hypothetical protein ELG83_33585 (plasmid) [Rhizobium leguminosarum]|nr:hypothetical protein ELG88_31895 [Rhizobium leguminosarum]TBF25149.1 hypothetical protein ELG92_30240 [Rhizobium leguminosarum]TBF44954.1 hypothetical protein ELG91_34250 [Rhizobium leguminosarum]TBF45155.1 hypothetical protein ELG90_34660 [Rhizobium leguminosarum]TBF45918.1 hypothetical protein ELG87_32005 [Rhizobium leguminosarum]
MPYRQKAFRVNCHHSADADGRGSANLDRTSVSRSRPSRAWQDQKPGRTRWPQSKGRFRRHYRSASRHSVASFADEPRAIRHCAPIEIVPLSDEHPGKAREWDQVPVGTVDRALVRRGKQRRRYIASKSLSDVRRRARGGLCNCRHVAQCRRTVVGQTGQDDFPSLPTCQPG